MRRLTIAAAVVVAALALWLGARVGFERDVMRLLPAQEPAVGDYLEVLQRFQGLDHVLLDLWRPGSPYDPQTVRAAEELARRLAAAPLIRRVRGRVALDELTESLELLRSNRANLFSAELAAELTHRLDAEAIAERVRELRRQLVSFPDPVSVRLFEGDPLGIDEVFLSLLPKPPGAGAGAVLVDGWLWSEDGEHLLLVAEPSSSELDGVAAAALVAAVEEAVEAARGLAGEQVEVAHLSRYRAALENEATVRGDIGRSLWVSLAAILVVLLATFGVSRRPLLLFLPPAFGGAVAMAALALVYDKVSPVVVGCGSILLGIAVDYAIHMAFRTQAVAAGESARVVVRRTARPLFLAAATTTGAFCTMLASSLPGHRQLGVFAASGVAAAAVFAVLVLPLVLPPVPAKPPIFAAAVARGMAALLRGLLRRRRTVAVGVVVVTLVAVVGAGRLRVETDLERFNALGAAAVADSRRIGEVWGGALGQSSFAASGGTLDAALVAAEEVVSVLAEQERAGTLNGVQSIVSLLPSAATQEANRRRWRQFWDEARRQEARRALTAAMADNGLRPQAVEAFWPSLLEVPDDLQLADFEHSALSELMPAWIASDPAGAHWVLSRCTIAGEASLRAVAGRLRSAVPGVLVADGPQMLRRLSALVYHELVKMSVISFALVAVILVPFSRSWRRPAALLALLVVTLCWTLGAMGWLGVPVTMMNSMIAIFLFGLTVDYGIFLLHALAPGEDRPELITGAVVVSSLTTLVGFGALLLADHPSLHIIGATTTLGVLCGVVASMTVIPLVGALDDADQGI